MDAVLGPGWEALVQQAAVVVAKPVLAFLFRDSIFYWPYLLASLAIAVLVYILARPLGALSLGRMLRAGLDRRIWLAPSAKADYRYFIINGILFPPFVLLIAPLIVSSAAAGYLLSDALVALFGPIETPVMGPVAIKVAYTIAFFLGYDFGHFVAHYLQHRVPLLWEFHKVHHSAQVLTPITSGRQHPVDLFLFGLGRNLCAGLATGVFFYLGAGAVTVYTFLGMHVLMAAYHAIGHLRHTHVWVSYGPLDGILISPAHHQIHHSALPEHYGKNNGFALAIWDRLFGTLCLPEKGMSFPMGLGDGTDGKWHEVARMYWWPVVNAVRLVRSGGRPLGAEDAG
jgi:sterol desaturase/sphingolipid hydroxylase (fatty acid hydroxylase superfamily)